jgi:hypothetical protein
VQRLERESLRETDMEEGDAKSPTNSQQTGNQLHHRVYFFLNNVNKLGLVVK